MAARTVADEAGRMALLKFIETHPLPLTAEIVRGRRRSTMQNRLQRQWINEIASQLEDQTPEEIRGFCKLTIGVPIMRAESEIFCEKYDRIIKPMPYETKIELMMEPMDFPVTRIMTVAQKTQYLDGIYRYWTERGMELTHPDAPSAESGHSRADVPGGGGASASPSPMVTT